jgi:PAS domain S-box-containing protein
MRIDPATPAPGTRLHRFRELFEHAPVAYLVTDAAGTIREANRLAGRLLSSTPRSLTGKPLELFVAPEDRWALKNRLWLAGGWHEPQEYDLRLEPRRHAAVPVRATVGVVRERSGDVRELRWLLHQRRAPVATEPVRRAPIATRATAGRPAMTAHGPAGHDDLASVLVEVVGAAATLLHADGAGLMLLYEDGGLRWVTATGSDELAFEQAQRDLGEGPSIDALERDEVVWSADLLADVRWARLLPAAPGSVRGVLAAPVGAAGRAIGTCTVLTSQPHQWSEADVGAMRAYAAVLDRLLATATDASRKRELADQLQQALDRRVLIEQAKGVLMALMDLDADQAFALIRREARSRNRRVADVARGVIAGHLPEPLEPQR